MSVFGPRKHKEAYGCEEPGSARMEAVGARGRGEGWRDCLRMGGEEL